MCLSPWAEGDRHIFAAITAAATKHVLSAAKIGTVPRERLRKSRALARIRLAESQGELKQPDSRFGEQAAASPFARAIESRAGGARPRYSLLPSAQPSSYSASNPSREVCFPVPCLPLAPPQDRCDSVYTWYRSRRKAFRRACRLNASGEHVATPSGEASTTAAPNRASPAPGRYLDLWFRAWPQ